MTTVTEAPAAVNFSDRINRIEPSATMAAVAEADKLRQTGVDVVDWTVGEPHFATPQHIKDAAIAAIQNNFTRYESSDLHVPMWAARWSLKTQSLAATLKILGRNTNATKPWPQSVGNMSCSTPCRYWWTTAMKSFCPCRIGFRSKTLFAMQAAIACCFRLMKMLGSALLRTGSRVW